MVRDANEFQEMISDKYGMKWPDGFFVFAILSWLFSFRFSLNATGQNVAKGGKNVLSLNHVFHRASRVFLPFSIGICLPLELFCLCFVRYAEEKCKVYLLGLRHSDLFGNCSILRRQSIGKWFDITFHRTSIRFQTICIHLFSKNS